MSKMKVLAAVVSACALCLALAGCGGGQPSGSASASGSAASSASQASSSVATTAAVTEETVVGDWQIGSVEANGARMTGDLTQLGISFTLSFNKDKTATFTMTNSFAGTEPTTESVPGNWSFENGKLALTLNTESGTSSLDFTANEDGTLTTNMDGTGTLVFQREPSKPSYDLAKAEPVTDIATIAGTYTTAGAYMMGVCIMGDTTAFGMADTTLTIKADGSAEYVSDGQAVAISISIENGKAIADIEGVKCPLSTVEDLLALDLTDVMGGGTQLATYYKKA